jgi:protein-tyrosine phosphatase
VESSTRFPDLDAVLNDARRSVALDGVHNFRDLGGYPAAGGTTRWGLVYRADGLGRLTSADVAALRARGLGAVIDLRTHNELSERGRYPVDQHEVAFHHLPVIDQTWQAEDMPDVNNAHDFLIWAYRDMLGAGSPRIARAIALIADPEMTPVVFHCAAGKDRTGLVAAMLLAALGVPDEYIAADYGKTAEGMTRMRTAWAEAAAQQGAEEVARMQSSPAYYFECPPEVMSALLVELRDTHGSLIAFLGTLGITDAQVEALRTRLIEPAA